VHLPIASAAGRRSDGSKPLGGIAALSIPSYAAATRAGVGATKSSGEILRNHFTRTDHGQTASRSYGSADAANLFAGFPVSDGSSFEFAGIESDVHLRGTRAEPIVLTNTLASHAGVAPNPLDSDTGSDMTEINSSKRAAYWKANLRLMAILLSIWFIISYGFGIILVEPLNTIRIGGYKLGFWFSQQGSMYGFVVLIFVYARKMAKLDREYGVEE
jgi:putative solute:sodium symporter small subunit